MNNLRGELKSTKFEVKREIIALFTTLASTISFLYIVFVLLPVHDAVGRPLQLLGLLISLGVLWSFYFRHKKDEKFNSIYVYLLIVVLCVWFAYNAHIQLQQNMELLPSDKSNRVITL